ncbi:MAG: redoxin domain-containing protein [Bacillota bacterium]|jgi:peroxiredoxin (alkyl hydroperoxide reductase subunit C)|nr:redoxin domain-containing protein [Bacillota bacterium]HOK50090.1 redoxin domain-containing protein [Sedimentibacter sp.]HOW22699.1 redoxin domain-containing protein [Sedimentibacter sp.]HRC80971.1 redoxin domain-containing protein [Sedimentibacter sp.]
MSVSVNQRNYCLTIGRIAPDFTALSTEGVVTLSQYRGKWVVIISEPGNFAATSTSSLLAFAAHYDEFAKRNVQILVVTIDNNFANIEWKMDILYTYGVSIPFPLLEDRNAEIAVLYGMVNPDRIYEESVRDVFIIGPEGRIKAILTYPVSCGRNTYEILRIIDSLQLTEAYNVYTPANWMPGDPVMLPTTQDFNEAKLRLEGQNGLFCPSWYNCYLDYNSLTQDRNNA